MPRGSLGPRLGSNEYLSSLDQAKHTAWRAFEHLSSLLIIHSHRPSQRLTAAVPRCRNWEDSPARRQALPAKHAESTAQPLTDA